MIYENESREVKIKRLVSIKSVYEKGYEMWDIHYLEATLGESPLCIYEVDIPLIFNSAQKTS